MPVRAREPQAPIYGSRRGFGRQPTSSLAVPGFRRRTKKNAPDDPGRLVIQRHWIPAFAAMTDSAFAFQEASELLRARRMAELAQRLRLDLADALARDVELLADLFERVVGVHFDAEAHAQH